MADTVFRFVKIASFNPVVKYISINIEMRRATIYLKRLDTPLAIAFKEALVRELRDNGYTILVEPKRIIIDISPDLTGEQ